VRITLAPADWLIYDAEALESECHVGWLVSRLLADLADTRRRMRVSSPINTTAPGREWLADQRMRGSW
jgi:hypothetical protein